MIIYKHKISIKSKPISPFAWIIFFILIKLFTNFASNITQYFDEGQPM